MFILSQTFAFITLICVLVMFQHKSKSGFLLWVILANIALTLSYVFLTDWVGTGLMTVATLRAVSFFFLEKNRAKTPNWLAVLVLLVFLIAHTITTALTWEIWFDWLLLVGALCQTCSSWAKGRMNLVRILNVAYSSLLIAHNIRVGNWMAIAVEAAVITSVIIYYVRRWYESRRGQADNPILAEHS